ncbi:hypothetical protein ACA910_003724 [Epithemia clementina (nom. ined.)]
MNSKADEDYKHQSVPDSIVEYDSDKTSNRGEVDADPKIDDQEIEQSEGANEGVDHNHSENQGGNKQGADNDLDHVPAEDQYDYQDVDVSNEEALQEESKLDDDG